MASSIVRIQGFLCGECQVGPEANAARTGLDTCGQIQKEEGMAKEAGGIAGSGFCPFSWIEVTKQAGCLSGIFGGKDKLVSEPQLCMGFRCKLWDSSENDCGLITKKEQTRDRIDENKSPPPLPPRL